MSGQINLQETSKLARLMGRRLGCSLHAARDRRAELLQSHLGVYGSHMRLCELLGENGRRIDSAPHLRWAGVGSVYDR
jgi:hypothetical protein